MSNWTSCHAQLTAGPVHRLIKLRAGWEASGWLSSKDLEGVGERIGMNDIAATGKEHQRKNRIVLKGILGIT